MKNLILLLATLTLTPPAAATSFVERPFPISVQDAPVIARGKIGNSYSDWKTFPDGNRSIYTFYDFQVEEVFKGNVNGRSIVLREIGGKKDGVGMAVAGTAEFERGEDVVVFLNERDSDNQHVIRGMMMGKFNVVRDGGKEVLAGPGISGGDHIHEDEDATPAGQSNDTKKQRWTLEDLRQLIASQASTSNDPSARPGATGSTPEPSQSPSSKAPQLQSIPSNDSQAEASESEGESGRGWGFYAGVILSLLAIAVLLLFFVRR